MSDRTELKPIPWTYSDGTIAVYLHGKAIPVTSDNVNYTAILSALRCKDWDLIPDLLEVAQGIMRMADGRIEIKGDELFYLGQPLVNSITDRILALLREGVKSLSPICNFLENVMANPNVDARERIFTFAEKSHLPLTPDGCLLAYRGVDGDFHPRHTGPDGVKLDNHPGKIVKIPRSECDEDSHQCCSSGLHFCSLPYLGPVGNWCGERDIIIVVKVNPRDVVAVPYTYQDTKARCCRFEVLRVWQASDQFKDLSRDAWEVSLVAEDEEVTSPAVRAMLNLERINEGLEAWELDGYEAPKAETEGGPEDYEVPEGSSVTLLPETGVQTVFLVTHLTQKTRKKIIRDLYTASLRAGIAAYALQAEDEGTRTQGDLKVTPEGRIYFYNKSGARWLRERQNIKLKL